MKLYRTLSAGRTWAAVCGAALLAVLCVPGSYAVCGFNQPLTSPMSWHAQPSQPLLLRTALATGDDSTRSTAAIVGMWHEHFITKNSPGIPDGTEIDAGFSLWHSDGTEMLNSASHNGFCMGVWERVGEREFRLNHFPIVWPLDNSKFIGPGHIQEHVTVSADGKYMTGTFTMDVYSEAGKLLQHAQGVVKSTRVTINTKTQPIY